MGSQPDAGAGDGDVPGAELARPGFFRAVAVDFDGTLTTGGRPEPDTLAALDEARAAGRRVVIVTGRILAELLAVFPDAGEHADAVVAETARCSTAAVAGSAADLERELKAAEDAVVTHHSRHADFSRWVADVLGDPPLAAAIASAEHAIRSGTVSAAEGRSALIHVIRHRYSDDGQPPPPLRTAHDSD